MANKPNLVDIKDVSPNIKLVKNLEMLLDHAKKGKLRSAIIVQSWSDDGVNQSYSLDDRTWLKPILAQLMMMQVDLVNMIGLEEDGSVLSGVLYDD